MTNKEQDDLGGKRELFHKPVPPYRAVFFIAVTVGVLYLGWILMNTL